MVELETFRSQGIVSEISTTAERGLGSRMYPAHLIDFDDGTFTGASIEPLG